MYMILVWPQSEPEDSFLDCVRNKDGSIKLFDTLEEADKYANQMSNPDDVRVISIEGVKE